MKTRRRLMALVMALVMVLSLVPAINAAVLPTIPNIAIDANNVVTWDAVDGAADYDWSIGNGGGFVSAAKPLTVDLNDKLASFSEDSGEYTFSIYARDGERNRISETWACTFTYTSKGKLATPTNLRWEDGIAKWDAVEHAPGYFVELYKEGANSRERYDYTATNEYIFSVENGVKYEFRVQATASLDGFYEGYTNSDFSERSAAAVVRYAPKEDIANVKLVNGVLTWDAYDGAAGYYWALGHGGSYVAASEARSVDLRAWAAAQSYSNGYYDVRLVAVDGLRYEGGVDISNQWESPSTYLYLVGDTRAEVDTFVGTSNLTAPEYGDEVVSGYAFTLSQGTQAQFSTVMGYWQKKDGEDWVRYDASLFTTGEYRYTTQLRIDDDSGYGSTHKLAPMIHVTVDGDNWEQCSNVSGGSDYTYAYVASPSFEVEWKALPITFPDSPSYDIGTNYVGTPITSYSVAEGVVGGIAPYTFSKISGPAWINVSADGTVSGTPTAVGSNAALVIGVTDSSTPAPNTAQITVAVADTNPDPNLRTKVDTINIISNFTEPGLGDAVNGSYTYEVTAGQPAYVAAHMNGWKKDMGGGFWARYDYDYDTFSVGNYRFSVQIRIDDAAGLTHVLADDVTVTVNGVEWETGEVTVSPGYSYVHIESPIIVIEEAPDITFADIDESSWQYPFAVYAVQKGLMAGKGTDGSGNIKFDPNSPITREEFVQVLYNAEGKPSVSIANPFPDVADGGWYKNAVLWAKQNDIASGKGNGNFGVGENISRQDLAMMLYKYAKLNGYSLAADEGLINGYADGDMVANYAKTAMDWAVTNGIMSGKGAAGAPLNTFRLDPTGIATRAECAAMLKNFQTAFGS